MLNTTIVAKHKAEHELKQKGFMFSWLTPARSNFDVTKWQKSDEHYDNFILFTRLLPNKKEYSRVVLVQGRFYYLTTQT